MKNQFIIYLINQGYSKMTKSGRPSTVYDYPKRIDKVCKWENMDWIHIAEKIDNIIKIYDNGGVKEFYGNKSHRAVINALKRFSEFLNSYQPRD